MLNDTTFTPYTITAREAISPSSFVITISPRTPMHSLPYLLPGSSAWAHSLWSVEFKQPEVQIARHYTPLPPQDGVDSRDGTLRFYIRAVGDGEMSNYLGRLRPGQEVHLRGPHRGFDVLSRLGQKERLVVLAGGTGLVPGLQAAEAVLGSRQDTTVDILWAIRKREELEQAAPPSRSSWWSSPEPLEIQAGFVSPSPVGRQLDMMKSRYGDRLRVRVAVDEEGSTFSSKFLAEVLKTDDLEKGTDDQRCGLHSQALQRRLSEFEMEPPACTCSGHGKNLMMVSGPDGFIGHYTGQKVWQGGAHTQGAIDGITGQLQRQQPGFQKQWLVLKL